MGNIISGDVFPDIQLNIFNNLILEAEEQLLGAEKKEDHRKILELCAKLTDLRVKRQRYIHEKHIHSLVKPISKNE